LDREKCGKGKKKKMEVRGGVGGLGSRGPIWRAQAGAGGGERTGRATVASGERHRGAPWFICAGSSGGPILAEIQVSWGTKGQKVFAALQGG